MSIKQIGSFSFLVVLIILIGSCSGTQRKAQAGTDISVSAGKTKGKIDTAEIERAFIDGCKFMALEDYNSAVEIFESILKADPSNHATLYQLGKIYIEYGQVGDALSYSRRAYELNQNNPEYALLYAGILKYSGQYSAAAEVYTALINRSLANEDTYFQLAAVYEQAKQPDKAIQALLDLDKISGHEEQLAFELQRLFANTAQYGKAVEWLQILTELNPDNLLYKRYLSDMYERNGQTKEAGIIFEQLLQADPSNTDLQFKKAELQQKSGDLAAYQKTMQAAFADPNGNIDTKIFYLVLFVDSIGRENFKRRDEIFQWTALLVQAHPLDAKSHAMRGDFLYYDNLLQDAADSYNKSLEIRNDVYDVWLKLFYIYADLEKYDSLVQYADMAIELFPNQASGYYFYGVGANRLENYADAVQFLRRGLPLTVSNATLRAGMYAMLGDAYHALEKHTESDEAYENSLKLDPDDVFTMNNYAYYLSLRKTNLSRAAELALRSNEIKPGNASLQDTYAWVLFQQGKYSDARIWIEKALTGAGAKSGIIHEHYGDILWKLGDTQGAITEWQRAKELGEVSEKLEQKLQQATYIE